MSSLLVVAGIIAFGLVVYLFIALLFPEKLQ
ncbi:MAG: K(+)-transporting ATPase subunit F [Myxococcales bacterium]|jgi:K+-transporting ATPase KdpF subunit|nr:K(+)-transporting ATPase subunit F [Myxococcales bacterium]